MARLRNRPVRIISRADHIDGSTFFVEDVYGEKEYAKIHELEMTEAEYNEFIKPALPQVKIIPSETKPVEETEPVKKKK